MALRPYVGTAPGVTDAALFAQTFVLDFGSRNGVAGASNAVLAVIDQ